MRMVWHGLAMTWDQYLDLSMLDRWYANLELNELIDRTNGQSDGEPTEPDDE